MSTTADQSRPQTATPSLDLGDYLAEVMDKIEEINCLLASVDVIAKAAYERGVEVGRSSVAIS